MDLGGLLLFGRGAPNQSRTSDRKPIDPHSSHSLPADLISLLRSLLTSRGLTCSLFHRRGMHSTWGSPVVLAWSWLVGSLLVGSSGKPPRIASVINGVWPRCSAESSVADLFSAWFMIPCADQQRIEYLSECPGTVLRCLYLVMTE